MNGLKGYTIRKKLQRRVNMVPKIRSRAVWFEYVNCESKFCDKSVCNARIKVRRSIVVVKLVKNAL